MISLFFRHATAGAVPIWLAASSNDGNQHSRPLEDQKSTGLSPLKVLIVEDEFFISLSTEAMLESLGHVVVGTAVSADEAVRIADLERPDIVLMDIRLIGPRDGIDAATEIHNRFGIRSIFVTANTDATTRQRALVARPQGFVEKPLTEMSLLDALSAAN